MQWKSLLLLFTAFAGSASTSNSPTLRLRSALISNSGHIKNVMKNGCNYKDAKIFDPYLKDSVTFKKTHKNEGVEMKLSDFTVTGLSDFLIINNRSQSATSGKRANFDVLLPQIQFLGQLRVNLTHKYFNKGILDTNLLVNIKLSDLRLYLDYDINFNGTLKELLKMDVRLLLGNVAVNNYIFGLSVAENNFYNKFLQDSILFAVQQYLGVSYNGFEAVKNELLKPFENVTIDQVIKYLEKIPSVCLKPPSSPKVKPLQTAILN